ncbi:MAG: 3D-(3,5/4)-trihydroxycyclohexane-1,2-dione acylhydrolase (decyclizing) [Ardenticatenaceae bacterium]|nr:3D-(3,5/4)-trihydroxycyclohexane-1,2-dione acylhydrolase (decyclizing) [Ardenticatenaceae bacterium]
MTHTIRMTAAQALIRFLDRQFCARDGVEHKLINGVFGIFGHGNVAGIGQALHQTPTMPYFQTRNEQAMVHLAAGYTKMKNRLGTMACTTSIGPGATNMVTAAAGATINRLPVLLLPGDIFARRSAGPLLQQIELPYSMDISANDAFRPVSRYWDRIYRPEQLLAALPNAMRTLTSQADTGAVTLALPHDVQAEAFEFPTRFFDKKVWLIPRPLPDATLLLQAAELIQNSKQPLIVAGGGVIYSEATAELAAFCEKTGIPVSETQAGKGSLHYQNPLCLGAIGVTGNKAANELAKEADLVIGIGTRFNDFMTSSQTGFSNPDVKFININIAEYDVHKQGALPLTGDARETLKALQNLLTGWAVEESYRSRAAALNVEWDAIVSNYYNLENEPLPSQAEVLGAINSFCDERDVIVNAAGSAPGDLHRLWRTTDPKQYHLEYGNSCMGYEIPGGIGAKMADPGREVYVVVGDGSYLMMPSEIVTAVQEGIKIVIILINNHGYASIGALSRSLGDNGFGTRYAFKNEDGSHQGDDRGADVDFLPIDLAANAESLGAYTFRCQTVADVRQALQDAKKIDRTCCIYVETDRYAGVSGYTWWDVPVAEVSRNDVTNEVYEAYKEAVKNERYFH